MFSSVPNAAEIAKGIPSLKKVVVVSYTDESPDLSRIRMPSVMGFSVPR